MEVIATKMGIYGSNRIRKGQRFEIPDNEELRSWMVAADAAPEPDEVGDPETLSDLADPVPEVLKPESGRKSGKKANR